jgi:hypothetical protein
MIVLGSACAHLTLPITPAQRVPQVHRPQAARVVQAVEPGPDSLEGRGETVQGHRRTPHWVFWYPKQFLTFLLPELGIIRWDASGTSEETNAWRWTLPR